MSMNSTANVTLSSDQFTGNSSGEQSDDESLISKEFLTVISAVWMLIAFIGIVANLFVILVIAFVRRNKTATHYFIVNLAISDTLFLAICPALAIANLHQFIDYNRMPFILAKIVCKLDFFSTHLAVFVTCLTLMSMTIDRYLAICHPLRAISIRTKRKAVIFNITIWISSTALSLPHGYYRVLEKSYFDGSLLCLSSRELEKPIISLPGSITITHNMLNSLYTICIAYLIPFTTIVVCYVKMVSKLRQDKRVIGAQLPQANRQEKDRRRVLVMIALCTILFGFNWLPIHGFHFAMKTFRNFPFWNPTWFVIKTVSHTFTYLNSLLNPFVYTIIGGEFRKSCTKNANRYSTCSTRANATKSLHQLTINRKAGEETHRMIERNLIENC
nr:G protein-coupled receptor [Proales similis]